VAVVVAARRSGLWQGAVAPAPDSRMPSLTPRIPEDTGTNYSCIQKFRGILQNTGNRGLS
jgi:hypothetical protein